MRLSRENSHFLQRATREFALLAIQVSLREFQGKKTILPRTWNTVHCSTAQLLKSFHLFGTLFNPTSTITRDCAIKSMTRSHQNHMTPGMTW